MVILLAEDDVGVRFYIWKLLRADGFTVLTAGDGIAALEVSRNHPGAIDLLLSDVDMPVMGGLELCQAIAEERTGIKVLMMSGGVGGKEQVRMKGLPFLQKPFTGTALRQSIKALLGPNPALRTP
jgi:DNA-binding response OmpR family regulator